MEQPAGQDAAVVGGGGGAGEEGDAASRQRRVRNVSVAGAEGHGKTTLARNARDGGDDEQQRQRERPSDVSADALAISTARFCSSFDAFGAGSGVEAQEYELCLIDTPGHTDLAGEVRAGLRMADGVLVVVDCIEGMCLHTETVLRHALSEHVRLVLVLSKLDQAILDHKLKPEVLYDRLRAIVDRFNELAAILRPEDSGVPCVQPTEGTVVFSSGRHGWGFTLPVLAQRMGKRLDKAQGRLWGDHYYDPDAKQWHTTRVSPTTGKTLARAFCQFVLQPIYKVLRGCMGGADKRPALKKHLNLLGIDSIDDATLASLDDAEGLMKRAMAEFLPLSNTLRSVIVEHLPSPAEAQASRVAAIYRGPMDDECSSAIALCDADGPLMVYIAKLVWSVNEDDPHAQYAIGRVFSGTLVNGQPVRIHGPDYIPGKKVDLSLKKVADVYVASNGGLARVESGLAGSIVYLSGLHKYLINSSTITTSPAAHTFKPLTNPPALLVRQVVAPNEPSDLPKLLDALRKVSRSCLGGRAEIDETMGELIISGLGERHLEWMREKTTSELASLDVKLTWRAPTTPYRETVTARSNQTCMAKSPNKHSRLWMTAEPLPAGLADAIESGDIVTSADPSTLSAQLYSWEVLDARRLWAWGPGNEGSNAVFNTCKYPRQDMGEIQSLVGAAFKWATALGALCEEPMRGVRFNVVDATLTSDSMHRGPGQIFPTTRRVLMASQLAAQPRLLEPVYLVETHARRSLVDAVAAVIVPRRGQVLSSDPVHADDHDAGLCKIRAYLPVVESFGFASELAREASGGVVQCVFDHWQAVEGDPLAAGSKAAGILLDLRRRKGLKEEIPVLDSYLDRL